MSDTPEPDGPISFVRWLHAQKNADKERSMPYAGVYKWGKNIHALLGSDGRFDAQWIALELAKAGANADDLAALVSAEAAWRVDSLVGDAEATLNLSGEVEDVVPANVSSEIEKSSTKILCGYRNHRGEGCVSEAVEGAGRCGRHGGAITDPEVRRSFMLVAFAKVIDGSRIAVEALLDVAENGRSEMARVQAAKELLDRAGVQQDQHVHIHKPDEDTSEDEMLALLRDRLSETKNRLRLRAVEITLDPYDSDMPQYPELVSTTGTADINDDVVDAEIVEPEPVVVER